MASPVEQRSVPAPQAQGGYHVLDTRHQGVPGIVAAFLVPGSSGGFVLVETGPMSTIRQVEQGIVEAGWEPAALEAILVTHVHLDHAGAAGGLARRYGAPVFVHERGAAHLVDPSRLVASAARVFGDQMEALWGTMEPVPRDLVRTVGGGARLSVAGRELLVIDTPGHARHHLSFLLDDGTLFAGDAAGIRLQASTVIAPATPPPEVDLRAWESTLARLLEVQPRTLVLTHFGAAADPVDHLERLRELHGVLTEAMVAALSRRTEDAGLDQLLGDALRATLASVHAPDDLVARYLLASPPHVSAKGLKRYLSSV